MMDESNPDVKYKFLHLISVLYVSGNYNSPSEQYLVYRPARGA
jgi:hypothetical protein